MPKLYIKEGVNKGCYFDLNPNGQTIVGRSSSCDIKLKDLDASRKHAELIATPDGSIFIRDLESKNGTFLNERRVTEGKVAENDTIRIGNTICTVVEQEVGGNATPPTYQDPKTENRETLLAVKAIQDQNTPAPKRPTQGHPTGSLGNTVLDPQVPKHQEPPKSTWEQLEGGATLMNLKREDLRNLGLSGMARKSKTVAKPESMDSTVHTMIDLKTSSALLKKEIYDITQLKKAHNYLSILYEVANTICSNLDLDLVLNSIMKMVFRVLRPDRGFILLYNEKADELEPKVYLTKEGSAQKSQITYSRSIIQKAIEEDSAVLSSDASSDERFSGMQSIINYNIRSAMCVPLKYQEKLLGVLQLDNRLSSGAFKQDDLELLTSICNLASMAIENAKLFQNIQVETRRRSDFERFLSPSVVEQVMRGEVKISESGEGVATILFSDIRSFTSIAESMGPQALVAQLNEYFEEMTQSIFEYEGTVDKFIGDAIMSVFGTPYPRDDDPVRAIKCSLDMLRRLGKLHTKWEAQGRPLFRTGIGINTGKVMLGNIGSERRMEFTVIGDAVNLSSRLESATKYFGARVIAGEESFLPQSRDQFIFRNLGKIEVKGKNIGVNVYEILGEKGETMPFHPEFLPIYEEGYVQFEESDWQGSRDLFEKALALKPGDCPSKIMINFCNLCMETAFEGIFVNKLESK